jgi:hypothetical protein
MNGGAGGREFYLRVGTQTQYVKINLTGGNVDDANNRFWQTTDKNQASRFIVDTSKTYGADASYKTIRLASYYDGTKMTSYLSGSAYLNHNSNWVYKSVYDSFRGGGADFHWKFEDATGGMKIRNPLSSFNAGLYFLADPADNIIRLRTASPFNTVAQTFTVEFSDAASQSPSPLPVAGGGGAAAPTDPFIRRGTISTALQAMQLSRDGRTGYINFTPNSNPGSTQNCTGRVNITGNTEFAVGNSLRLLDYTVGGSPLVAVITSRFDNACYLEVTFRKLEGGVYNIDTSISNVISRNTTNTRIEYGTLTPP